jgi:hypothetical protein
MPKKRRIRRLERRCSPLPVEQILDWADRFGARHGSWPNSGDGRISYDLSLTWNGVNEALRQGYRGLPGGSSMAQLLAEHRGHRNVARLPDLTVPQMLVWADEYHRRNERWPTLRSGPILNSGGESWQKIERALRDHARHLSGYSSLATGEAPRGAKSPPASPPAVVKICWPAARTVTSVC